MASSTGGRFSALAELGVDVYAPRRELPAAAPSLFSLQARAPVAPDTAAAAQPAPAVARPVLDLPDIGSKPKPRAALAVPPVNVPVAPDAARFQLLTVAFDSGVLFISDLRTAPLQPALEATVVQFLRELMFALGRPAAESVSPVYFQWPLVSKPGADISAARAWEVLAGFVDRCVRETRPEHLVLLGERASEFVQADGERLGETPIRIWRSVALGKFFVQPGLKAELWQTLQPLRARA